MTTELIESESPETTTQHVPTFTRADAIASFKKLITQYGSSWGATVPQEAFDQLKKCNLWLTELDRREIISGKNIV